MTMLLLPVAMLLAAAGAQETTSNASSTDISLNAVDISTPIISALQDPNKPQPATTTAPPRQPASHKLIIGNWIAQWDTQYKAWFYYNIKSATSTWTKPEELSHVAFKSMVKQQKKPLVVKKPPPGPRKKVNVWPRQAGRLKQPAGPAATHRRPYVDSRPAGSSAAPTEDRILVSDYETSDFFGFNTTYLNKGDRGVVGGLIDMYNGLYENIVKDYVTDVYTDVIEGYSIATIKLFGWFFVGSMLTLKGIFLNYMVNTGRSFQAGEEAPGVEELLGALNLNGYGLNLPSGESLEGCYGDRPSCRQEDLPAELDYLLVRAAEMKEFFWKWLGLAEKLGHMAEEGEL